MDIILVLNNLFEAGSFHNNSLFEGSKHEEQPITRKTKIAIDFYWTISRGEDLFEGSGH